MFSIGGLRPRNRKLYAPGGDDPKVSGRFINPKKLEPENSLRTLSEYDNLIELKPKDAPDNIIGSIRDGELFGVKTVIIPTDGLEDPTTVPFGGVPDDALEDPAYVAVIENHLKTSQDEIEELNEKERLFKNLKRKEVTEPVEGYYADYQTPVVPVELETLPAPTAEVKEPSAVENDHPNKSKTT